MSVYVPSAGAFANGRVHLLRLLLDWLCSQGVSMQDVYIFVPREEKKQYQRLRLPCHIVGGILGLALQHNFAFDWFFNKFGSGHHVISFNDDVLHLARATRRTRTYQWGTSPAGVHALPPTGFLQLCHRARRACSKTGALLWGVSTSEKVISLAHRGAPPKHSLGLVVGGFFGFFTTGDSELKLTYTTKKDILEDVERSLRYFVRCGVL